MVQGAQRLFDDMSTLRGEVFLLTARVGDLARRDELGFDTVDALQRAANALGHAQRLVGVADEPGH
jgi:hypothetical protein